MENGVFREIKIGSDGLTDYTYIDVNSTDTLYYSKVSDGYVFVYYDPKTELVYSFNRDVYEVLQYESMEYVAGLFFDEEGYELKYNFQFMDGWNKMMNPVEEPGIAETYYTNFYLDSVEVFEEYNVLSCYLDLRYYLMEATIELDENEYQSFQFPEEFTGGFTMDTLRERLEYFLNLEDPFLIINSSSEDFFAELDQMHSNLND